MNQTQEIPFLHEFKELPCSPLLTGPLWGVLCSPPPPTSVHLSRYPVCGLHAPLATQVVFQFPTCPSLASATPLALNQAIPDTEPSPPAVAFPSALPLPPSWNTTTTEFGGPCSLRPAGNPRNSSKQTVYPHPCCRNSLGLRWPCGPGDTGDTDRGQTMSTEVRPGETGWLSWDQPGPWQLALPK